MLPLINDSYMRQNGRSVCIHIAKEQKSPAIKFSTEVMPGIQACGDEIPEIVASMKQEAL